MVAIEHLIVYDLLLHGAHQIGGAAEMKVSASIVLELTVTGQKIAEVEVALLLPVCSHLLWVWMGPESSLRRSSLV